MKMPGILFSVVLFIGHGENPSYCSDASITGYAGRPQDSVSWIQDFRKFRDAMYQNDRTAVKSFIDFPIINDNNEIWFLVYGWEGKGAELMKSDKKEPMTEKDFDRYYAKIFGKTFIQLILKIKTEELFRKGETETAEISNGKATSYKIYSTFDTGRRVLSLNLSSNTIIKDAKGEETDRGESNTIYEFHILKNGHIKFMQVRLAG